MYKKINLIYLLLSDFMQLYFIFLFSVYQIKIVDYRSIALTFSIILGYNLINSFGKQKLINFKISELIICGILSILFLIMLPINQLILDLKLLNINDILIYFYVMLLIISILFSLIRIFSFNSKKYTDDIDSLKKTKKIIMLVFIVLTFIYVFSSNTGFYDSDFPSVWNNIRIDNWHTYAYSLFVHFCKKLFASPYPIIWLQSVFWLFSLNYSLKLLILIVKKKKALVAFAILQIILLVGFKQVSHLWKDTIFSIGIYCYILTIIDFVYNNFKFSKRYCLQFMLFGMIVSLFRHSGWVLILLMTMVFIVIFLILKYYKKVCYMGMIGLISISSFFLLDFYCRNIRHYWVFPKYVTYTVPIYQVGSFVNNNYYFSDDEVNYVEMLYPLIVWRSTFEKYNGDSLARSYLIPEEYHLNMDNFNYSGLLKLNFSMFINEPIYYLKSLLELEHSLWRFTDLEYWNEFFWICDDCNLLVNDEILETKTTFFNDIKNVIERILFDNSLLFDLKSRGGFAVYVLILLTVLCIYKKQYKLIIPIIPLMIWWCLLFISMPRSLTRYIVIFIISCPILLLIILNAENKKVIKKCDRSHES